MVALFNEHNTQLPQRNVLAPPITFGAICTRPRISACGLARVVPPPTAMKVRNTPFILGPVHLPWLVVAPWLEGGCRSGTCDAGLDSFAGNARKLLKARSQQRHQEPSKRKIATPPPPPLPPLLRAAQKKASTCQVTLHSIPTSLGVGNCT